VGVLGLLLVATTACQVPAFGWHRGITPQADRMLGLWKGSAVASLIVGAITVLVMIWCVLVYRKRDDKLPKQISHNLGVEVVFTFLPFIIVAGLFYYTVKDENFVEKKTKNPDITIGVEAFRWNWEFRHIGPDGKPLAIEVGRPSQEATLVLPVGKTIRFLETSPDVIHSFWVPAFLFKLDVIPGRTNSFEISINKTGTYVGRCAELCGVDHDRMNFQVKVVSFADYQTYLAGHPGVRTSGDPDTAVDTTGGATSTAADTAGPAGK
jgi:cytochrome c oxidase subunit 2